MRGGAPKVIKRSAPKIVHPPLTFSPEHYRFITLPLTKHNFAVLTYNRYGLEIKLRDVLNISFGKTATLMYSKIVDYTNINNSMKSKILIRFIFELVQSTVCLINIFNLIIV